MTSHPILEVVRLKRVGNCPGRRQRRHGSCPFQRRTRHVCLENIVKVILCETNMSTCGSIDQLMHTVCVRTLSMLLKTSHLFEIIGRSTKVVKREDGDGPKLLHTGISTCFVHLHRIDKNRAHIFRASSTRGLTQLPIIGLEAEHVHFGSRGSIRHSADAAVP